MIMVLCDMVPRSFVHEEPPSYGLLIQISQDHNCNIHFSGALKSRINGALFHSCTGNDKRVVITRYRGQSSWLQIQRSGFDSRRYQIF
jgi:hypothetical protein